MARFTHQSESRSALFARRRSIRQGRRGFTLLEVIVVVVIIALLATMVAPRVWRHIGSSQVRVAQAEVETIAKEVHLYLIENNLSRIPNDFQLELLTEGDRPPLGKGDLIDPWGNPYVIRVPGIENHDFDIVSFGANGEPGGEGEDAEIVHGRRSR